MASSGFDPRPARPETDPVPSGEVVHILWISVWIPRLALDPEEIRSPW
jgi:hypothetical protein